MRKITKHTIIRFFTLAIPYFIWFAVYAENGYNRDPYNFDLLILFPFFFFGGLIFIETIWHIFKKNKLKFTINICLILFFIFLYFILPHRDNFK